MDDKEELNLYSDNLKKIRNILNISLADLSSKIGIPQRTITSYEQKERLCSAKFIANLHKYLNINANWFVTGEGEMFLKNYSTVGERIQSLLIQHNIPQSHLAVDLNIKEQELNDIINGNKMLDLNMLSTLKLKFNISADWLLYGE